MAVDRTMLFLLASSSRFERAVRGVPMGEELAWRAASRYVAGPAFTDAACTARELAGRGVTSSIDQFGERVGDAATAEDAATDYRRLAGELRALPETAWLSVDLSHLGLDVDVRRCAQHLSAIAAELPAGSRIQVGAEDSGRADAVLECVLGTAAEGLADRLGATLQANLRRSRADLDRLVAAGVHVRLVKGAFVEAAGTAWPYGEDTDLAYLRLARRLADAGAEFSLATHDAVLREALLDGLGPRPVEQLLGVRPEVLDDLVARGIPARVYVPFGPDWFRYWMRRVAESRGV